MSNASYPGPAGPAATGINYAYVGCYAQTGGAGATTGLALPTYQNTYVNYVDSSCSTVCRAGGYIYMGTVNTGTSGATCWCGNQISYVRMNDFSRLSMSGMPCAN